MKDYFYQTTIILTCMAVFFLLGLELGDRYYDHNDINKDGKVDIVDLSVLAERIRTHQ